jgi:hypothetical protein
MDARVRSTGSVASALDAIGASHLLVPARASSWNDQASRDPRLTRIYDDGYATIYRVIGIIGVTGVIGDSGSRSVRTTDR